MVHAKKSLGQNFLNAKSVARDIVHTAALSPKDTVLEIGPGKGFLTGELLATGAHVIAVEKDDRMIPLLQELFAGEIASKQFFLIHGDIVELLENDGLRLPPQYKLVANIPYYLTGYILRAFLESTEKPSLMVLMVQKEVAARIVARDKKESILSISVKAYGVPKLIKKVPARYFTPAPRVDSAILLINNISNKYFSSAHNEKQFFEIVKNGFAHKRKVLSGNLKQLWSAQTPEILAKAGIKENARAEDISLEQWLKLTASSLSLK